LNDKYVNLIQAREQEYKTWTLSKAVCFTHVLIVSVNLVKMHITAATPDFIQKWLK